MIVASRWIGRIGIVGIASAAWLVVAPGESRGDRIQLKGGGTVKGKLIPDKAHPGQFQFLGETGKSTMVFTKAQILQVTPEKGPLDDYVVLREQDRPTVEAEHELGLWCEEHKLPDLAQVHFEAAVKRDSTFGPAHMKLGHVEMGGRWLNADEVREAQGMVKYKGRWMQPEEKERREAHDALVAESGAWIKKIRALREQYVSGTEAKSRDAERRLMAITEASAIGPVARVLADDQLPPVRLLATRVLGGIPDGAATTALVAMLLNEVVPEVRTSVMAEVRRRPAAEVVPLLVQGLGAKHSVVINRAAWALANMNAVEAVPKLIPALITIEYEVVMVPDPTPSGGGGGGSFSTSNNRALPVLTPPVVRDGVVAYGATSVPYATSGAAAGDGSGVNFNGGGAPRGQVQKLVPVQHQNAEVLNALNRMTGRDFGFDVSTWKRWVATSFKVAPPPSRKVLEP